MSTLTTIESSSPIRLPEMPSSRAADHCEIVRHFSRLEGLASDWNRLWGADPRGEVFQSFAWARAAWRACGGTVELCTPVVFAASEVLGILPLIRRNGRLEFLGAPHADYGDVICSEAATPQVLEWSLRELQKEEGWREGLLDGLPEESRTVRHFAKLPGVLRGRLQLIPSEKCYTVSLDEKPTEILDRLANKQHLRRRQHKLERTGKVSFRHLESIPEALQHLEHFFICQRRRRAIHGKTSAGDNEEFRQLLRHLVQEFDLKNELHFGVLELDGKPLGWHLSFEVCDKLVFYQQTFEVDAWDFAPGDVLLRHLLLFAKQRVHREFDFTRGDEPFKARYANRQRTVYKLWLQRPGLLGRALGIKRRFDGFAQGWIRNAQTVAKAEKGVFEGFRSTRAWWREWVHWLAGKRSTLVDDIGFLDRSSSFSRSVWENKAMVVIPAERETAFAPASRDVHLAPGRLGDLVDFAQQNSGLISPTRVLGLRERFRKGDRALLLWRDSLPVQVAWVSSRPLSGIVQLPVGVPELGPALTVYELWRSNSGNSSDFQSLLDYLLRDAASTGLPLRIFCPKASQEIRTALERHGFQKLLEVHRQSLFGKS